MFILSDANCQFQTCQSPATDDLPPGKQVPKFLTILKTNAFYESNGGPPYNPTAAPRLQ